MKRRGFLLLPAALALAGCSAGSMVIRKPDSEVVNDRVTALWAAEVRRTARTGDWLLTRSYSFDGDVISTIGGGESLSHASMYDAERGTIIEAMTPVVREVPLESLLARNHYVIVVRPTGQTASEGRAAAARARTAVGSGFDYGGVVGMGDGDRFYCTELLVWASDLAGRGDELPAVVVPSDLLDYGEVVYFSGARTDPQVQAIAVDRPRPR